MIRSNNPLKVLSFVAAAFLLALFSLILVNPSSALADDDRQEVYVSLDCGDATFSGEEYEVNYTVTLVSTGEEVEGVVPEFEFQEKKNGEWEDCDWPVDAGHYKVKAVGLDRGWKDYVLAKEVESDPFDIRQADFNDLQVEFEDAEYTGHEVHPSYTMTLNGVDVKGEAYLSSWSNNINVGTASATFLAGDNFTWNSPYRTFNFTISTRDITPATVELGSQLVYTGNAQKQSITSVSVGSGSSAVYVPDDAYDVTYTTEPDGSDSRTEVTDAGTYYMKLTPKKGGNFSGVASKKITVEKAESGLVVDESELNKTYGDVFSLGASASGDAQLTYSSSDSSVIAVDESGNVTATGVGTAEITVKASETSNYKAGELKVTVTVDPKDLTEGDVTLEGGSWIYDGTAHEPAVTVTDGETFLAQGTDYELEYSDNVNAGSVKATVKGMGNYTGSVELGFDIQKAPLTVNTESATKVYDGTALTAGATLDGLVNGETATVTTTKSQTKVGQTDNDGYEIAWETALENNYEVSLGTVGTLTVTEPDSGDGSGSSGSSSDESGSSDSDGSESASAKTADEAPIAPIALIGAVAAAAALAARRRVLG